MGDPARGYAATNPKKSRIEVRQQNLARNLDVSGAPLQNVAPRQPGVQPVVAVQAPAPEQNPIPEPDPEPGPGPRPEPGPQPRA